MYSPKIAERFIPPLYRLARARGQHMTTLVTEAIEAYLAREGIVVPPPAPAAPAPPALAAPRVRRGAGGGERQTYGAPERGRA